MGPFRVVSRTPEFFKVALPGRGTDSVNVARLKPAIMAEDDDDPANPPPATPPSPPPPGRRPGIRTRIPQPTDRSTRRRVRFDDNASVPPAPQPEVVDESIVPDPVVDLPPEEPPVASSSSSSASTSVEPVVEPIRSDPVANQPPAARPQPRFFTRHDQRTFSRQKPSYGAVLNAILTRHCTNE